MRGARAMGWVGFNCSLPHKVAVIEHLDGLGESAALIGAVNCVVRRDGRWIGENTDGQGFVAALRTVVDRPGRSSSSSARAAPRARSPSRPRWRGAARDHDRQPRTRSARRGARRAARRAAPRRRRSSSSWDGVRASRTATDIVVNATSIGLFPDVDATLDVDLDDPVGPGMVVADVIPNPPRTRLIRDAEARGCTVLDGIGMLVNQGVIAIRHWTGVDADATVMRRKVESLFGL